MITGAEHVVEVVRCSKGVSLVVCVKDYEHLVQMAHIWLLRESGLCHPEVYQEMKLMTLTMCRNNQNERENNRCEYKDVSDECLLRK